MQDSQDYRDIGKDLGVSNKILDTVIAVTTKITDHNPDLTPVVSLKHLSTLSKIDYRYLRSIVCRHNSNAYFSFRLRKNSQRRGYRTIVVPQTNLMTAQRWILQNIVSHEQPHSASCAYQKGKTVLSAAEQHCKCQWMIKLDIRRFFESFSEIQVYHVFVKMGYSPLVSFEMTRICTRLGKKTAFNSKKRWRTFPVGSKVLQGDALKKDKMLKSTPKEEKKYSYIKGYWEQKYSYDDAEPDRPAIEAYQHYRIGHLPQGAPTSPALANLIMRDLDKRVAKIAQDNGLVYTRYSDDITLSTQNKSFGRKACQKVISQIYAIMSDYGLSPNTTKTKIVSPGAKKQVLGLLVDRKKAKLGKKFRDDLRLHLYYLGKADVGPKKHAEKRNFASVTGLRNHITGLIAYAAQIDPDYAKRYQKQFRSISWPEE